MVFTSRVHTQYLTLSLRFMAVDCVSPGSEIVIPLQQFEESERNYVNNWSPSQLTTDYS